MLNRQNKYINTSILGKKLYKTNAAMLYNETCRQKQLTPNYISIKLNGYNHQRLNTIQAATHYRLN
jgi:hypothetical protein